MWEISVLPKLFCKSKSVAKFKKKIIKKERVLLYILLSTFILTILT